MVHTATWLLRVAVVIAVGVESFTGTTAHGAAFVAQTVAVALGAALLIGWAAIEWHGRRHPALQRWLLVVLAGLSACAAPCTTSEGGALIAFGLMGVIAAGSEPSLAIGIDVTALAMVSVIAGGLIGGASAGSILGYSALLLFGVLAGSNRRFYRVQAQQAELLRVEQRQVAALDERSRIAREIHDVLAHSLGALSIQIQTARAVLSDERDIDRALKTLDTAQRMVTDGLTETARAVHALRTDSEPLTERLRELVTTHSERHQVPVDLDVRGVVRPLAPDADLALLRAAQEALVNAAKHSAGQPICARLDYDPTMTTLTISNPLPATHRPHGFTTIDGGYGLLGMRERILLLDGSLSAAPENDRWTVTAKVPQ